MDVKFFCNFNLGDKCQSPTCRSKLVNWEIIHKAIVNSHHGHTKLRKMFCVELVLQCYEVSSHLPASMRGMLQIRLWRRIVMSFKSVVRVCWYCRCCFCCLHCGIVWHFGYGIRSKWLHAHRCDSYVSRGHKYQTDMRVKLCHVQATSSNNRWRSWHSCFVSARHISQTGTGCSASSFQGKSYCCFSSCASVQNKVIRLHLVY